MTCRRARLPGLLLALLLLALLGGAASCHLLIGYDDAVVICDDCRVCVVPADCGTPPPCEAFLCAENICRLRPAPAGTPCAGGVCNGKDPPACGECAANSDCEPGAFCSFQNECYRCDDGIQNGDERGVDCEGDCPLRCLGDFCFADAECKSGHCADGRCCDFACSTLTCTFCGDDGKCEVLPKLSTDNDPPCGFEKACNGDGLCLLRPGQPCQSNIDCIDFKCENGFCAPVSP
jgi:hypothetical protein